MIGLYTLQVLVLALILKCKMHSSTTVCHCPAPLFSQASGGRPTAHTTICKQVASCRRNDRSSSCVMKVSRNLVTASPQLFGQAAVLGSCIQHEPITDGCCSLQRHFSGCLNPDPRGKAVELLWSYLPFGCVFVSGYPFWGGSQEKPN